MLECGLLTSWHFTSLPWPIGEGDSGGVFAPLPAFFSSSSIFSIPSTLCEIGTPMCLPAPLGSPGVPGPRLAAGFSFTGSVVQFHCFSACLCVQTAVVHFRSHTVCWFAHFRKFVLGRLPKPKVRRLIFGSDWPCRLVIVVKNYSFVSYLVCSFTCGPVGNFHYSIIDWQFCHVP